MRNKRYIMFSIILLIIIGLSVGFSALQKQLSVHDMNAEVRLQEDVRVSSISVSKVSGSAVSNFEDYNKSRLIGSITLPNTSSYVLYKVDLTNYGNIKSGLLDITSNESGVNYSICDSNGNNCTTDAETKICNGSNCTLGTTKEIYVKVSSNTTGTKNVSLDLNFQPYNDITYVYFQENTSSFKKEIMSTDSYSVTFTSKPEEVEITGEATYTYNKNTGVLNISTVSSDITISAKYLINDIAETSYSGVNPNNYVLFNDTLYRIVTKENIDDGYSNTELRTKIVKESSIGNNVFDNLTNVFASSSLKDVLNTTYFNTIDAELIDTALWTEDYSGYIGIISKDDYTSNSSWLTMEEYTITPDTDGKVFAVTSSGIVSSNPNASKATYPSVYLKKDVLVVDGDGTKTNPYILELAGNGLQPNPTKVLGRTLTVTGSNQELATIENKVGTVYFSTSTRLTSENYTNTNISSPSIPVAKNAGSYTIYYYIPAWENYKQKSGTITTRINPLTFIITYQKGANVSAIGKSGDSCTTQGASLTCNVTLPSITPETGYENGVWKRGNNSYNVGSSFTLSNNDITLTAEVTGSTYTATFVKNGATEIGQTSKECTVSSGSSCSVTSPTITRDGFTIIGWSTDQNAQTGTTAGSALTLSGNTTFYAITKKDVTGTFYYNSNNTSGSLTVSTETSSCTIWNSSTKCTLSVPTAVQASVGKYNSTYKGVSTSTGNMNSSSLEVSANTTYYANYSKNVTNYYYDGSYKNRTLHRNEYFTSNSEMGVNLATTNALTTNYTTASGPGSSTWIGLSTGQDTTAEYANVAAAAQSNASTLYTVYEFNITYAKGSNVSAIGATSNSCKVTISNTSCNVTLPSITPNDGYTSVGWGANGATTGTSAGSNYSLTTNNQTLYANAKANVYKIVLDNQNATTAGTTQVWYQYNTTNVIDGTTCYYYTNSSLTTCLTNGYYISGPTKTGYTYGGYYTNTAATGTQYVNASNSFINNIYQKTPKDINSSYTDTITLYAKWTINNPATPTISGAATKVYGNGNVALTCATSTTYASGTEKYYSFGYATTDGGTPSNWTTATTSATYNAPNTYTTRYYSCRVYATDGTSTSSTVASSTNSDAKVTYVNARIDFDATTNGGTLNGTTPLYAQYGSDSVYTGNTNTTASTIPTASKIGHKFSGWFTSANGGTKVINADGTLVASVSNWTNSSKKFAITSTSNTQNTNRLYAQFTTNTYTVSFNNNGGSGGQSADVEATYGAAMPSISTTAPTKSGYTFMGWYDNAHYTSGTQYYNASGESTRSFDKTSDTTLYAGWKINDPATPSLSGGTTKVYNHENTTLTCVSTTNYSSDTYKYFEFGYSTTSNGTVTWLGSPSTTATLSVAKDAYRGTRYYTCRVYASNGTDTTAVKTATAQATVTYVNARIDFDATTNGGTLSGTTPIYVPYGSTDVYTGRTNTTSGSIPTATKDGWTFNGWYTAATNGTKVINADGSLVSSATSWVSSSKWAVTNSSDTANTNKLYAQFKGNTYTANFYYNSNTTSGSLTVASRTATCTVTSGNSCTVSIPTQVSSSVGKYNSAYKGVSTSQNSMGSSSLTITGNTTFYANYSSEITIYRPTSASAASSTKAYRNEYFTSNSAMDSVVSTSNDNTTAMTSISGLWSSATFAGYSTSANTSTVTSGLTTVAASIKNRSETTYYVIGTYTTSVSATFYYSKDTNGTVNSATASGTQTRNVYCSSTTAAATNVKSEGTISAPTLSGETAPSGTTAVSNFASANSNMSTGSTYNTGTTKYYRVYRNTVTVYKPSSTSACNATNTTFYRNAFINTASPTVNTTTYTKVLSATNTGTSNDASYSSGVDGYTLEGYANATSTNTITYADLTALKNSTATSAYAVLNKEESVTATFYYSKDTSGTVGSATASGTKTTYLRCTSTTAASTNVNNGTITAPTLTGETAPSGTSAVSNFASANTNMSTGSTYNTGTTKYYRVYRNTVTVYKPSSTSACNATNTTFYRNAYINTDSPTVNTTTYTKVLATSNTGTTNNASYTSGVSGYSLEGYASATSTNTITYADLNALRDSSATSAYAVLNKAESVTATFYYSKDTNGTVASATASGNKNTYLRCTSNSAAGTNVSNGSISAPTLTGETAPSGTAAVTNFASANSSMSTGSTYDTGTTKYYRVYRSTVTVYKPSSTSACNATNTTFYRNSFINTASPTVNTTTYTKVLSSSNTGTTDNASYTSGVSGYSLIGYANATSTNTITYADLTALKNSTATSAYAVLSASESVTATFYYSKDTNGTVGSATANGTKTTYLRCTSNSAAATNVNNGSITAPSLTGETAPTGTTAVSGFAKANSNMNTTTSYDTATTKYYRVYRNTLTIYRPTSTSAAGSVNAYRNAFINTASPTVDSTTYTKAIATSSTGTSDMTSVSGLWSSATFGGYSTSVNTSTVTSGLTSVAASIKNRTETTYYVIGNYTTSVTATFYYSKDTNGTVNSATASGTQTRNVYCSSTTAAATNVKSEGTISAPTLTGETAPSGTATVSGFATANSNMSATTTYNTGTTKYYRVYRNTVTVYKPSSTSACNATNTTFYRNAYINTASPTVNTTTYSKVLSSSNTGTSDNASYTSSVSGYSLEGYANATSTNTITYADLTALKNSTATSAYAVLKKTESVTATFYYSKDTNGTVASATANGTKTTYLRCTSNSAAGTNVSNGSITAPSLTGETAPSGTTAVSNFASANSSMSTGSTYNTGTTKYYRVYRNTVTVYKPSSTSACNATNTTFYRNAFINTASPTVNTTTYTKVLSATNTGTSNDASYTSGVSGYSLAGYANATSTHTITYANLNALRDSTANTAYAVLNKTETVTATFYYNSNTTSGSTTVSSKTADGTKTTYLRCTSNSASGTDVSNGSITIPSEVTVSGGTYNNKYVGVANATGTMSSATTADTSKTKYYAVYRTEIKIYYPSSTSAATSKSTYQNQWFTSDTAMATTVLSNSSTGTSTNATASLAVSGYDTLVGFNASASTNTATWTSISALTQSDSGRNASRNVYEIDKKTESVTATFYYSKDTSGTVASATANGTKTTYLRCTSTSAAGTSVSNGTITAPTLTGETAPSGTTAVSNFASANSSMSTGSTYNTGTTKYYRVYRNTVTVYKPSSTSACNATNTTFYRNAFINTASPTVNTTTYTKVLATSNTGTTDNASYTSGVSGYNLAGYANATSTNTITYADLTALKNSTATSAYAVLSASESVTATFYYSKDTNGTVGSATASGTKTTYLRCTSTSAAGTNVSNGSISAPTLTGETAPSGTTAVSNFASANSNMSTGSTYNTGTTKYYRVYRNTVTVYKPSSTSACNATNTTFYRNAFINTASPTVNTTTYTKVLSATNTGTSNDASYSSGVDGYTLAGFASATSTNTITYANLNALRDSTATSAYALLSKGESVTATFYYSKDTSGTVGSATASGTKTTYLRCTSNSAAATNVSNGSINAPTLSGETAPTGTSTISGFATANSNMSTTTTYNTGTTKYYRVYRKELTIYRPTSASAASSVNAYRNAYINTASPTVDSTTYAKAIATTNTGTSDMTSVSGLWSSATFGGYSTSVNTSTVTSGLTSVAASIKNRSETTYYVIGNYTTSVTATFYYSKDANGTVNSATASGTQTRNVYCTSTTAATTNVKSEGTISAPTLSGETAPTGTATVNGFATANSNMSTTTTYNTGTTKYYRVYRNTLTIYRPTSASAAGSVNAYRNAFINTASPTVNTTTYTKVVAATNTGTSDMTSVSGLWSSATFAGYSTSVNTSTVTSGLTSVAASIKNRTETTYYVIGNYTTTVTATFYYSKDANGTVGSATASGTQTRNVYCSSTSAATTNVKSEGSITAPSTTGEIAPTGTAAASGFATTNSNMTATTSYDTATTKYYRIYRNTLAIYRPTSASDAGSVTAYRNAFINTASPTVDSTTYAKVIATSSTGTSDMTSVSGLWSSATFGGYSTSVNTSTVTSGLTSVATSIKNRTEIIYYVIGNYTTSVTATFYYSKDTNGTVNSATASGTQTRNVYCSSTSAATTNVKSEGTISAPTLTGETAPSGTTAVSNFASANSNMSTGSTYNTGTTKYYRVYRSTVTVYKPSSTSACNATNTTFYRNAYINTASPTVNTTTYTKVLSATNTGTSNDASYTSGVDGYTLEGYANATSTNTITYADLTALKNSTATSAYAVLKKTESVTATFYYNSNTTSGSTTVSSKTASGTKTTYLRCTSNSAAGTSVTNGSISIPSEVSSSGGTYNNKYVGVANATGTMSSATTADTSKTKYYAVYRTEIKIYYPSSTSAATSKSTYQNQWFTSDTAMATTVLSNSSTGTSTNATASLAVDGYDTLVGFNTSASTNTATWTSIAALTQSDSSKNASRNVYEIDKKTESVTATFYFSKDANGTVNSATSSGTRTTYLRCTSNSAAGTNVSEGTISAPTISGETAPSGTAVVSNFASANSNMSTGSSYNTGTTKYYRVYRNTVTIYKPSSTSACNATNTTFYRNAFINTASPTVNTTTYTKVLSNSNTGTSNNASYTSGVDGYTLAGYASATSTNTITYANLNALRDSSATSAYAVLSKAESVTATFYFSKDTNGTVDSATSSGTRTTYLRCTSNSAAGTNVSNGSISAPTLTGETAPTGTAVINGFATANTNMSTTTSYNTGTTKYYRVYRNTVTIVRPTSASAVSGLSTYRNAFINTASPTVNSTTYTRVIATTNTGTTSMTSISGIWSDLTFSGYATSANTATVTSGLTTIVESIKNRSETTYYVIGTGPDNITFVYNSNTTSGSVTNASATTTVTSTYYCKSASSIGIGHGSSTTIPTEVTNSVGKWNSSYDGVGNVNSLERLNDFKGGVTYYAIYKNNVTIYFPKTETGRDSMIKYRNEYYSNATTINTVLADNTTTKSNFTFTPLSGYTLHGFATTVNTTTINYESVALLANSDATIVYAVLKKDVAVTFHYNNHVSCSSNTITTTTSTGTRYLKCTASGASKVEGNVEIPAVVTSSSGPTGVPYGGVTSIFNSSGMLAIINTSDTDIYAIYSQGITDYYYDTSNSQYSTKNLLKYELFSNATSINSTITGLLMGQTSYLPGNGPNNSTFYGFAQTQTTTREFTNTNQAANACLTNNTLYEIYQYNVNYEMSTGVSAVGADSDHCEVTYDTLTCSVTLPSITLSPGYTSAKWVEAVGDTVGYLAGASYIPPENNKTVYAKGTLGKYLNTTTNVTYSTLRAALNAVQAGETIKVLQNNTETLGASLREGIANVTLDLNGKTISTLLNAAVLTNNGGLTITGSGQISSAKTTITNNGILVINGGTITTSSTSYQNSAIVNGVSGTLTISGGTIDADAACTDCDNTNHKATLVNDGILSISGGSITHSTGAQYCNTIINNADMNMTGGTVTNPTTIALYQGQSSVGTVNLSGGLIQSLGGDAVNTASSSNINISGTVTIQSPSEAVHISSTNNGNVTISGGTLIGDDQGGVFIHYAAPGGTLTITGGTISGTNNYGLYQGSPNVTVNITGGTITGYTDGLYVKQGTTVTLGTNSSPIYINNPSIGATTGYGANIESGGVLNFYDGEIKSSNGTGYSINGTVSATPAKYRVVKSTSNGVETATLSNLYYVNYNANGGSGAPSATSYNYASSGTVTLSSTAPTRSGYVFKGWATSSSAVTVGYAAGGSFPKNTAHDTTLYAVWARWSNNESTKEYYTTLASAVSGTTAGKTITLLISYTDTSAVSIDKELTINLFDKTLTRDRTITVASGGDVHIFGSTGTLTTTAGIPITNSGTLSLEGGTITTTANVNVISNSGTFHIIGGTVTQSKAYSAVVNTGTMSVLGGTIQSTSGTLDIAAVENRKTFTMSKGTVSGTSESIGLWHPSSYSTATSTINGGTLSSGTNNAIWNQAGTINANGGTMTASPTSHYTVTSNGTLNIAGATIESTTHKNALYLNGGTNTMSSGKVVFKASGGYTVYGMSIGKGSFTMTGGTIGANSDSVYGGVAIAIFKDANSSTAGTFTLNGGTVRTYSDGTNTGRTIKLITGTFNYKKGTVTAGQKSGTTNSNKVQLWMQNGTTYNNTTSPSVTLSVLTY